LFEVNTGNGMAQGRGVGGCNRVGATIFPGDKEASPSSRNKIAALPGSSAFRSGRERCSPPIRCLGFTDKARWARPCKPKGNHMSTIGVFTKQDDGFNGTLRTLAFNVKVKIVPIPGDSDKGPHYRVLAGALEIGAAWKRQSKADKPYLSVKLDDPSFPVPVNARLIEAEDGSANLYWTRPSAE
jgi:uncharacterized protein (DUF736 family)